MSFWVIVVVGNEKGQVGVGVGKVGDVIGVVCKGVVDGKKYFVKVLLICYNFILIFFNGCDGVVSVFICFVVFGIGVIVGGFICIVFEFVGIKNVLVKCLGSKIFLNNVWVVMVVLLFFCIYKEMVKEWGIFFEQIYF